MSSARHGILAGGNWIVDRVKLIDNWPAQDALASILAESSGNGGSPYNILKALARFGAGFPLEAAGLVGEDADGRAILADCAALGIDRRQLRTTAHAATSYTDVMTVRGSGRRTFFHQRGANALLDAGHFDFTATRAKFFHLGYLLLLDRLDEPGADGIARAAMVLARARSAGLRTSIDLVSEDSDRFSRVVLPVLPQVDVLFANDFEAERLTGQSLRRKDAIRPAAMAEVARRLFRSGVRDWVVLHCPEGIHAGNAAGEDFWQPSVRLAPAEIEGTAGAGDAVAAGVLYGLHEGWPAGRWLQLAAGAAAACLRHPTCSEGILSVDGCLELGRRRGFGAPAS